MLDVEQPRSRLFPLFPLQMSQHFIFTWKFGLLFAVIKIVEPMTGTTLVWVARTKVSFICAHGLNRV